MENIINKMNTPITYDIFKIECIVLDLIVNKKYNIMNKVEYIPNSKEYKATCVDTNGIISWNIYSPCTENILMDTSFYCSCLALELFDYFDMMGIPSRLYGVAASVEALLHEIGHVISDYNMYKQYGKQGIIQSAHAEQIVNKYYLDSNDTIMSNRIKDCGYSYSMDKSIYLYRFNPNEILADRFALKHFPYVWKRLVELNII